jgi:hypothetical protein
MGELAMRQSVDATSQLESWRLPAPTGSIVLARLSGHLFDSKSLALKTWKKQISRFKTV